MLKSKKIYDCGFKCFGMGDVNGDGKLTVSDCVCIEMYLAEKKILNIAETIVADFNADGIVDENDSDTIAKRILKITDNPAS